MTKLVAFLTFAALCALSAASPTPAQQTNKQAEAEYRQRVAKALSDATLHDAAKIRGHVDAVRSEHANPLRLEDLVATSTLILRGHITANRTVLTPDQKTLYLRYEVAVDDVFKGSVGSSVVVLTPGGRWQYEDGTTAEVRVLGFPPLDPQGSFYLFLRPSAYFADEYITAGGPQGVYQIIDATTLRLYAGKRHSQLAEFAGLSPEAFGLRIQSMLQ